MKNKSVPVSTVDNIEFIDLAPSDTSPLVSECTIKVMYVGMNRNGSYIDKPTAIEMAKTLRSCPIVGAWRKDIEDFGDHGHVVTIEDGEIKFACKTVPYGFVAPDARVWFQKFTDVDDLGNEVEHEYMMTTGYLWTGQFKEAQSVIDEGKPQSMEIDEASLDGRWAKDAKDGLDFFIINDAMFSKLCILGDDVEPCFEGASVTGGVDDNFTESAGFAHSLYAMIRQLNEIVGNKEGGKNMQYKPEEFEASKVRVDAVADTGSHDAKPATETDGSEAEKEAAPSEKAAPEAADAAEEDEQAPEEDDQKRPETESALDDERKDEASVPEEVPQDEEPSTPEVDDETAPEKKPDVAPNALAELESENERLREELASLRQFKNEVEDRQKDELIDKYHMLSDEDKADVVAHKRDYTLEQIDEKLALVYVHKNVDFSTVDGHADDKGDDVEPLLSFSLDNGKDTEIVSDIQAAFRSMEN